MTTAVTPTSFRAAFPAFTSPSFYPDGQIQFYITEADALLSLTRFGRLRDTALQYLVAHELSLGRQAQILGSSGGVPGAAVGVMSSQSAGRVSTSFNSGIGQTLDMGYYALTTYGQAFYRKYLDKAGMGPLVR